MSFFLPYALCPAPVSSQALLDCVRLTGCLRGKHVSGGSGWGSCACFLLVSARYGDSLISGRVGELARLTHLIGYSDVFLIYLPWVYQLQPVPAMLAACPRSAQCMGTGGSATPQAWWQWQSLWQPLENKN